LIEQARQRQQVYVGIRYPKAATIAEVQTELEPDVALLEYAVDGGEALAFVTTRTRQRLISLGDANEVLGDVEHVRSALVPKAAPAPDPARLRRLGARLLDPLLATLPKEPKVRTLLIAAHGDLARIPFEILLVEDPKEGAGPTERPYLLTRHDVAYVHSGTVMRAMRFDARTRAGAGRTGPELVGFGFPFDAKSEEDDDDSPERGLVVAERAERAPLPGSAAEVLEIARLFAKGEKETKALDQAIKDFADDPMTRGVSDLTGERFSLHLRMGATEKALKEGPAVRTARILHVACHGEADLISPALSRLVLAQSGRLEKESREDGFVYLRELRDLGISAELLVLSACETNAGRLHPLEGITGLSRAGLAAGAESVISTFWRVDDAAARSLMVDFYRRWMEGRTTRIAALCDAKRSAIKGGIPMKTWAAYALWDAKTR
jgi:CHAT domain-containing protein